MFKITLLSISGFICSFAIHKAKYSQLFSGLSILSFGALLFILFNPAQFELFWNYVLVLHILLIGFLVDKTIGTIENSKSYIQLIALISMKITLILFAIIVLFMMLFYWYKKPEIAIQKIIIFSLLFVFTLYTLVGLTTPVLGAAVRYKVPALPFLLISLFLFSDQTKLSKFISVIKKR